MIKKLPKDMIKVRVFDIQHELFNYDLTNVQEVVLYYTQDEFDHILEYQYDTDLTEYISNELERIINSPNRKQKEHYEKLRTDEKKNDDVYRTKSTIYFDDYCFEIFPKKYESQIDYYIPEIQRVYQNEVIYPDTRSRKLSDEEIRKLLPVERFQKHILAIQNAKVKEVA